MPINVGEPGTAHLMMGNEAIARGALEGGVGFAAAYPGTPSSEIIGNLATIAKAMGIYVEWSVNEIVALEAAAGASFAGVRALIAMKHNGLNVVSDFLANLAQSNIGAGMVLVACEDPNASSSSNEEDIRPAAKWFDIPLLEPGDFQEAKDMTKWLFSLSEQIGRLCMLRGVTRTSHARGNVVFGEIPKMDYKARFNDICDIRNPKQTRFSPWHASTRHPETHAALKKASEQFETSPFNKYIGPDSPELLIITCGSGYSYTLDTIGRLGLEARVGVLKLGTIWPLPENLVKTSLKKTKKVLFAEEVDPFLEQSVMELAARNGSQELLPAFYGKWNGYFDITGELNSDKIARAVTRIMGLPNPARDADYEKQAQEVAKNYVSERSLALCPGCPHRATYWAVKNALRLDGRDGFVTGDIGCYSLGLWLAGYYQLRTHQCMGAGIGVANGLGKLGQFGFDQPVIAAVGDSTFFHAAIPALINAVYNKSNFTLLVLDNGTTAMTSFQPHPGTGITATGEPTEPVRIEALCQALRVPFEISDPFQIEQSTQTLLKLMNQDGVKVMIMRRECELQRARKQKRPFRMSIDTAKCIGADCGCNRVCTRIFGCPGLVWNKEAGKAQIDDVICAGCGVCTQICPQNAIIKEAA